MLHIQECYTSSINLYIIHILAQDKFMHQGSQYLLSGLLTVPVDSRDSEVRVLTYPCMCFSTGQAHTDPLLLAQVNYL